MLLAAAITGMAVLVGRGVGLATARGVELGDGRGVGEAVDVDVTVIVAVAVGGTRVAVGGTFVAVLVGNTAVGTGFGVGVFDEGSTVAGPPSRSAAAKTAAMR